MNTPNKSNSVWRDGFIAFVAMLVMFAAAFAVNYVTSFYDHGKAVEEMHNAGKSIPADLPSVLDMAVSRTTSALYGFSDLTNLLAVCAAGGFLAFLVMKWGFPKTLGQIGDRFDDGWSKFDPSERTRWKMAAFLIIFFAVVHGRAKADGLEISTKARDTIIYYECGGRAYYEKYLQGPTVPAWQTTSSGVTVGPGIDVGQMTAEQIERCFKGVLPRHMIDSLQSVRGLKGARAYREGLPKVKGSVRVTWPQLETIFENYVLPEWSRKTEVAFRLQGKHLHGHENGALICCAFNRGTAMEGDRRREMRNIRGWIAQDKHERVPGEFRSMTRLWSPTKLKGLHLRYRATADLYALGTTMRRAG